MGLGEAFPIARLLLVASWGAVWLLRCWGDWGRCSRREGEAKGASARLSSPLLLVHSRSIDRSNDFTHQTPNVCCQSVAGDSAVKSTNTSPRVVPPFSIVVVRRSRYQQHRVRDNGPRLGLADPRRHVAAAHGGDGVHQ